MFSSSNIFSMMMMIVYRFCQYFLNMLLLFIFLFFIFVSSVRHWYNLIDIIGLCFYYILWTRFVSASFTVFYVVFRGRCLWVQWFLVHNLCWCFWLFCFHMCSSFSKWFYFHSYIYDVVVFTDFYEFNLILMVEWFYDW